MRKVFAICLLGLIVACSTEKQGNMIVQGNIKGLKKGTWYLQKMVDTVLVSVDSVSVLGQDSFILSDNVDSPEVYFLTFDANNTEQKILFFGEQGTITINDDVKNFGVDTKIEGSKNQKIYEEYLKIMKRLQGKKLDLLKATFDAQKEEDQETLDSLTTVNDKLVRRSYLYAINFALTNTDSEVAPYIALTDLTDAQIKYLDTINNTLSDKVKNSIYGKQLEKFIQRIKETE